MYMIVCHDCNEYLCVNVSIKLMCHNNYINNYYLSSIYSVRVSASNDEAGFGTIATVNVVTGTVSMCTDIQNPRI